MKLYGHRNCLRASVHGRIGQGSPAIKTPSKLPNRLEINLRMDFWTVFYLFCIIIDYKLSKFNFCTLILYVLFFVIQFLYTDSSVQELFGKAFLPLHTSVLPIPVRPGEGDGPGGLPIPVGPVDSPD